MLRKYNEFLFESLILESIVVYSDKFRKILSEIDSPVSQALKEVETKDLDVANNCKLPILKCGFKEGFENEYMDFYNDKILN